MYEEDPTIFVRLDGTMGDGDYSVVPVTGVNTDGEEFVTKPISRLSRKEAFQVVFAIIYGMNGTAGRLNGESEFTGDQEPLFSYSNSRQGWGVSHVRGR